MFCVSFSYLEKGGEGGVQFVFLVGPRKLPTETQILVTLVTWGGRPSLLDVPKCQLWHVEFYNPWRRAPFLVPLRCNCSQNIYAQRAINQSIIHDSFIGPCRTNYLLTNVFPMICDVFVIPWRFHIWSAFGRPKGWFSCVLVTILDHLF